MRRIDDNGQQEPRDPHVKLRDEEIEEVLAGGKWELIAGRDFTCTEAAVTEYFRKIHTARFGRISTSILKGDDDKPTGVVVIKVTPPDEQPAQFRPRRVG